MFDETTLCVYRCEDPHCRGSEQDHVIAGRGYLTSSNIAMCDFCGKDMEPHTIREFKGREEISDDHEVYDD